MVFQGREKAVECVKVLEDGLLGIKQGSESEEGTGRVMRNTKPIGHCSESCFPRAPPVAPSIQTFPLLPWGPQVPWVHWSALMDSKAY